MQWLGTFSVPDPCHSERTLAERCFSYRSPRQVHFLQELMDASLQILSLHVSTGGRLH